MSDKTVRTRRYAAQRIGNSRTANSSCNRTHCCAEKRTGNRWMLDTRPDRPSFPITLPRRPRHERPSSGKTTKPVGWEAKERGKVAEEVGRRFSTPCALNVPVFPRARNRKLKKSTASWGRNSVTCAVADAAGTNWRKERRARKNGERRGAERNEDNGINGEANIRRAGMKRRRNEDRMENEWRTV